MKFAQWAGAFWVAASLASVSVAQTAYPSKPVKVVVGYAAGGAVDVVARTIGQSLQTSLGQPFVIENKPGANSTLRDRQRGSGKPTGSAMPAATRAHPKTKYNTES